LDPTIIQKIAVNAIPLLFCIILHEVSHGYVAERLGDPTARMLGRLTINPLPHIDRIGTVLVPLILLLTHSPILFGWAKPVPITVENFRNPRRDMAISAAAGPVTNIILGIISAILLRMVIIAGNMATGDMAVAVLDPLELMLKASIQWNVLLAVFNMIPILPLDGGRVLYSLLPPTLSYSFSRLEPYGLIIMIALWYLHILDYLVWPPAAMLLNLLRSISGAIFF